MSTIDSFTVISAITIGKDLKRIFKKNHTRTDINWGILFSILISLVIILFFDNSRIIQIWFTFGSYMVSGLLIPFIFILFNILNIQNKFVYVLLEFCQNRTLMEIKMVKIYSTSWCPSCVSAKRLLEDNNIQFEEINIEEIGMSREQLFDLTGGMSVPQIIINNQCIGGYDKLLYLHQNNKLEKLLNEK